MRRFSLILIAGLVGLAPAICGPPAHAQFGRQDGPAGMASTGRPLDMVIEGVLDFSQLTSGHSGGSAQIDPRSGQRQVEGDVRPLGGMAYTARVRISGEPLRAILIHLPDRVELRSFSGQRVWLRAFETDLDPAPRLNAQGELIFLIGARLDITGGVSGDLRGRIPISVEYE